ncbi:NAD(P)H-dependent flavin oxidoreductase [Sphingorhabdus sp. Alg231-15]|uniref:NAD(P)H-dependent flavin oxidoreductase n=1 Tax=Sphingorhabdus sp. Alg231-15 TaxID=1922222 RepID=UPI00307C5F49
MPDRITSLLSIRHPIILAPMAGVSGGKLAAAVSDAGGLGLIGGGYGDEVWLRDQLSKAGTSPIGVGFIGWSLDRKPGLLDLALDYSPKTILLSFGGLENHAGRIRSSGITLIAQVQTLEQARSAADLGADIIVAQGSEAGGHCGERSTFPLVPAIVDKIPDLPVVAAGGIADGRGLAAALMLGAKGVMCGSVFFPAPEALSSKAAKNTALKASGDDTVRSSVFDLLRGYDWPEQWKMRSLRNASTNKWDGRESALKKALDGERRHFDLAVKSDDPVTAPVIVGEAIDQINQSIPAGEIVEVLAKEAQRTIQQIAAEVLLSDGLSI